MNPDKRIIIDDLTARVNASPFLIVVDYTSITVPEFTNLRSALAACGAQCHVAKNNFMRTALTDAGLPDIGEHLVGQTAFVTGASDVAGAAKAINTFAKASKKAEYRWRSWMEPFFPRMKSAPSANCLPATSCLPNSLALSTRPVPLLPELFRHMWTKKTAAAKNPPPNTNPLTGRSGCTLAKCVKIGPDSPTGSLSELRPEN